MNFALLGAKYSDLSSNTLQTVEPVPRGLSSVTQRNTQPPHSSSAMPRWRWYQLRSTTGSCALKKMPPMPVTRFMLPSGCLGPCGRRASMPLGQDFPQHLRPLVALHGVLLEMRHGPAVGEQCHDRGAIEEALGLALDQEVAGLD